MREIRIPILGIGGKSSYFSSPAVHSVQQITWWRRSQESNLAPVRYWSFTIQGSLAAGMWAEKSVLRTKVANEDLAKVLDWSCRPRAWLWLARQSVTCMSYPSCALFENLNYLRNLLGTCLMIWSSRAECGKNHNKPPGLIRIELESVLVWEQFMNHIIATAD